MAQQTLRFNEPLTCPLTATTRSRILRIAIVPWVALLIACECLRDVFSLLQPRATLRRYRVGRLALGIHSEVYVVLWTGRDVYVRPAGCFGVLAKWRAGHAGTLFEAMMIAQQHLGTYAAR